MLPASAVPVKVGVVTLVMPSVLDGPVSDAAFRLGVDGATGADVSIVTDAADEASTNIPSHIGRGRRHAVRYRFPAPSW